MKKVTNLLFALLFTSGYLVAQDTPAEPPAEKKNWELGGMGGVTFNQAGLFNWQGGGNSNMTLIAQLGGYANYKKNTTTWDNSLELGYGWIFNNIFSASPVLNKAEDKINFLSKYGKKAFSDKVFYTGYFQFQTQFARGFSTPEAQASKNYISQFMAPAYVKAGFGLDWRPADYFSMTFAPLSTKVTIVADDSLAGLEAFGVNRFRTTDPSRYVIGTSKNIRGEFGATLKAQFKKDIMKNIGIDTRLDVFFNYLQMPAETRYNVDGMVDSTGTYVKGQMRNTPWHADVDWQTTLVAKVNEYIAVNFFTHLIYDADVVMDLRNPAGNPSEIGPTPGDVDGNGFVGPNGTDRGLRVQFKEIFGIGFTYKFPAAKKGEK